MSANLPFSQYLVKDKARGTLASGITDTASSFTFTTGHGAKFPASDFCVKIDDETCHVATRTSESCTSVTRGYNGTTAASHVAGATVYQSADASLIQRIYDNLSGHNHVKADITDFAHTHAQGDITNLVSDLAGKAASTHNILTAHNGFPGGTTDFLRADGSFAAPSGGSDPWTYLQVNSGSDFTTTSATAVDVTGLAFTPAANTTYEFEATLLVRTSSAAVNPRAGLAWPSGGTDGVAMIEQAGATAVATFPNAAGNLNAALLIAVGGLLNATQSWPVKIVGMFRAGASPLGNVRVQLASETGGTTVRIVARSFLKHRTLAF